MDRSEWVKKYDGLAEKIKARIVEIRDSGKVDWKQTTGKESREERDKAVQHNLTELNEAKDSVYDSLMAKLRVLYKNVPAQVSSPEHAGALACGDWLDNYPQAYSEIEHLSFG